MLLERKDLIYPELSYKIIGCTYDVFNQLGGGHKESVYQNALKLALNEKQLSYKEQLYYPVSFNNTVVGRNYFDFLIDEKIVVELKASVRFTKTHYDQVLNYLNISNLKLALLITFGTEEVRCKRVVNFKTINSHTDS
ncbi:MAG: GxxExxY protein [Bacteroidota bacterium]